MSQRLDDRIKELCAKAVATPESPELEEILQQLQKALHEHAEPSESWWLTIPTVQTGGGDPKKLELSRIIADGHGLCLVPFGGRDSRYVEVLGVLQLNVCAKRFIERFIGLLPGTRSIGHGLFDADDLMALGALAEAVTGAIHFVPWSKPIYAG